MQKRGSPYLMRTKTETPCSLAFATSSAISFLQRDLSQIPQRSSPFLRNSTAVRRSTLRFGLFSQKSDKANTPNMVFTGIVEEMGDIVAIDNLASQAGGVTLTISANVTMEGVKLGDSISVNGTCLTITELGEGKFTFGLAPETLRRTNLGQLRTGSRVNLERSLAANGRFGGHVVQGHVDCTGEIVSVTPEKDAIWYKISIPRQYMKYIVEKGYVAVDGTSLTVCDVFDKDSSFTFMMIPFTQAHVITALKAAGDIVNIELDITGKYIERIMSARSVAVSEQ